jgi:hypothetical protein
METMNMADNQSREEIKRNNHGELIIKVRADVDVSEALTGLKALQREAKEATKALRELEAASNGIPDHVKKYGKGSKGWSINSDTGPRIWFSEDDSDE